MLHSASPFSRKRTIKKRLQSWPRMAPSDTIASVIAGSLSLNGLSPWLCSNGAIFFLLSSVLLPLSIINFFAPLLPPLPALLLSLSFLLFLVREEKEDGRRELLPLFFLKSVGAHITKTMHCHLVRTSKRPFPFKKSDIHNQAFHKSTASNQNNSHWRIQLPLLCKTTTASQPSSFPNLSFRFFFSSPPFSLPRRKRRKEMKESNFSAERRERGGKMSVGK